MSEGAGIEPRTIATSALAVKRSNHLAKFHGTIPNRIQNSDSYQRATRPWIYHNDLWDMEHLCPAHRPKAEDENLPGQ